MAGFDILNYPILLFYSSMQTSHFYPYFYSIFYLLYDESFVIIIFFKSLLLNPFRIFLSDQLVNLFLNIYLIRVCYIFLILGLPFIVFEMANQHLF